MSFFGKLKGSATPGSPNISNAPAKKDPNAPQPTPLEKHLLTLTGPVRPDGSDKFFGFENYGSTCYCNSILQCLYYSAPFRENVINFPPLPPTEAPRALRLDTSPNAIDYGLPKTVQQQVQHTPGPQAANSPARKPIVLPNSPEAQTTKPDDKESPEYKKKMAMRSGPVLDMQMDNAASYGMEESLFTAMKDIFESVIGHQSRTGVVSPHKFLEILKRDNEMFRSAMHQDAHEFLNLLLNSVVDNVEEYSKSHGSPAGHESKVDSGNGHADPNIADAMASLLKAQTAAEPNNVGWVHDLFEGLLTSETRCLTCETTSQRDERFMDLSVDLEAHSSVTSCLRKFSEEEMLCERNKFHCDNCGGLQEAEKRMKIKRLPRILALHLKRFKYTEDYGRLQKLFHRVVYPYQLRLFNTTDDAEDPDRLYELYAVVVHIGGGPYHGHYVSIIKTEDRGWLMFDDELVEPVDKSFVRNFFGGEPKQGAHQDARQLACAYVLFYQETTLEKVQKEMEEEGQAAAAAAAAAESMDLASPTTPSMGAGGFFGNGLRVSHTVESPYPEDAEPAFASLAHAATAPAVSPAERSAMQTSPFIPSGAFGKDKNSRKEAKQAEKQAEKERKLQEKEAEKALKAKRKEAADLRRDRWRKQDDDLKAAIEASKATKADEDHRIATSGTSGSETTNTTTTTTTPPRTANGSSSAKDTTAPPPLPSQPPPPSSSSSSSGLSRFRHGSVSLRQKQKFWSISSRDAVGAPPLPEHDVAQPVSSGHRPHASDGAVLASVSTTQVGVQGTPEKPPESKRGRFSLGRKKSSIV